MVLDLIIWNPKGRAGGEADVAKPAVTGSGLHGCSIWEAPALEVCPCPGGWTCPLHPPLPSPCAPPPEPSGEDHLNMGHVSVYPKDVEAGQEHRAPLAQTVLKESDTTERLN